MYWYLRQYLVVFQKKNCFFTALVGIQNLWILHGKFVVFVTVNLHLLIIGSSPVGQGPLLPPPGLPTSLPCMWKKTTAQWKNKKKTSNMETSWNFSENSLLRRTKSAPDAIMRLTITEHIFVWLIAGSVKDLLTVSLIMITECVFRLPVFMTRVYRCISNEEMWLDFYIIYSITHFYFLYIDF